MPRAIVIIHHFTDGGYCAPIQDRKEPIGVLIQNPDETNEVFDNRAEATRVRLSNLTIREQFSETVVANFIEQSYMDDNVYSGYLETEETEIL